MSKSSYFFGQSVFGQLISLINTRKITAIAKEHKSDYYVKKFDTSDHLISMLFATFRHAGFREVGFSEVKLGKVLEIEAPSGVKITVFA
jgi:hypothetical protein